MLKFSTTDIKPVQRGCYFGASEKQDRLNVLQIEQACYIQKKISSICFKGKRIKLQRLVAHLDAFF